MQIMDEKIKKTIIEFQKNEITEHYIYKTLSRRAKSDHNRDLMIEISDDELRHYNIWKKYSGKEIRPNNFKRWLYVAISTIFGLTFGIKLMEGGESNAQVEYAKISKIVKEAEEIQKEESEHEMQLINMIDEEKLKYMGSVVLGLNDALVEFTGALAGFTFALQNSRLISMAGLIMGLSASLSMGASEYLSAKTETGEKSPVKASFYTGAAYVITVFFLVFPFMVLKNPYLSLIMTIAFAVLLIFVFSFYFSVVREISFKERFAEMFIISMGVAGLSFLIGMAVRGVLHIDV